MATTTDKNEHAILVRLPMSLHEELKIKAENEHRSVVGQVRHLIERDVRETEKAA
jgi:hypothetical protein